MINRTFVSKLYPVDPVKKIDLFFTAELSSYTLHKIPILI